MGRFLVQSKTVNVQLLFSVLLLSLFGSAFAWRFSGGNDRVLLSQVDTLILYGDRTTEYRRTVKASTPSLTTETVSAVKVRRR
jgi:hypothetical protein